MEPTDLEADGTELLQTAGDAPAGRAARQLPSAGEGGFTQTLMAIRAGEELAEHASPASASLQLLRGRAQFITEGGSLELQAGSLLALPPERHSVRAIDDAVLLLTAAKG